MPHDLNYNFNSQVIILRSSTSFASMSLLRAQIANLYAKLRRMHSFILCQNYMMFLLVLYQTSFEAVYCFLRSPKGARGCCSISDYLSCSYLDVLWLYTHVNCRSTYNLQLLFTSVGFVASFHGERSSSNRRC